MYSTVLFIKRGFPESTENKMISFFVEKMIVKCNVDWSTTKKRGKSGATGILYLLCFFSKKMRFLNIYYIVARIESNDAL